MRCVFHTKIVALMHYMDGKPASVLTWPRYRTEVSGVNERNWRVIADFQATLAGFQVTFKVMYE